MCLDLSEFNKGHPGMGGSWVRASVKPVTLAGCLLSAVVNINRK